MDSLTILDCGGIAQLGEHLPCKQGVRSSNLLISIAQSRSTNLFTRISSCKFGARCVGPTTIYSSLILEYMGLGPENLEKCIGK